MKYALKKGARVVYVDSSIHRDAYLSSGWKDYAPEKEENRTVDTAEQEVIENQKRRVGRPKKEQ